VEFSPIEIVGYVGSILIIISMTRTSILQLRLIGLVGSLTFLVYSLLIRAYPVAVVNAVIVGVHVYFLRQLTSKKKEFFKTLELYKESRYLQYFLDFHAADIEEHSPGFRYEPRDDQVRVFVLRDVMPAGLFIGRTHPDGTIEVELDYVIPQYRDFKVAEFLYSRRSQVFAERGCRRIWTRPGNEAHIEYFRKLGFTPDEVGGTPALVANLDTVLEA